MIKSENNASIKSLMLVRQASITVAIACLFFQLLLGFNYDNIISNVLTFSTFYCTCLVVFHQRSQNVGSAVIGTAIFLNITANSLAPMLGTLLEGHQLTYTLLDPIDTFIHRSIFSAILLLSFFLVNKKFLYPIEDSVYKIGKILKTRTLVSVNGVWAMGLISCTAFFLKLLHAPEVITKVLDGFALFLWVPFILLVKPYQSLENTKGLKVRIFFYYLLMIILSFITNSRSGMVGPLAVAAAAWFVTMLMGITQVTEMMIRKGIIVGLFGFFLMSQFADMSTAILIERAYRDQRSAGEQLQATWNTFMDKTALNEYQAILLSKGEGVDANKEWQENYIHNPFIGRFVQIKFDDNCFNRIKDFGDFEKLSLREATVDKVYALLPDPMLNFFHINIDKKFANSYSIGDKIESLSGGGNLGSFATGSIPAHAFALFSWWYPLVLLGAYLFVFSVYDGVIVGLKRNFRYPIIYTYSLFIAYRLFVEMSLDGAHELIAILIRGFWQMLLTYFVCLIIIRNLGIVLELPKRLIARTSIFLGN